MPQVEHEKINLKKKIWIYFSLIGRQGTPRSPSCHGSNMKRLILKSFESISLFFHRQGRPRSPSFRRARPWWTEPVTWWQQPNSWLSILRTRPLTSYTPTTPRVCPRPSNDWCPPSSEWRERERERDFNCLLHFVIYCWSSDYHLVFFVEKFRNEIKRLLQQ